MAHSEPSLATFTRTHRELLLALPLGERDQGDLFLLDEVLDGGDEGLAL
jgi:hypothetical protein